MSSGHTLRTVAVVVTPTSVLGGRSRSGPRPRTITEADVAVRAPHGVGAMPDRIDVEALSFDVDATPVSLPASATASV
jgi:hypothetical protein